LKIIEGVHPYRVNRDEPKYPAALPGPPSWLDAFGPEFWHEYAALLQESGAMVASDHAAFVQLCDADSRTRRYPDDNRARDRLIKLLIEFGMSPSARSRIRVPSRPADALSTFLERKKP
jgi:phage terminase small subunit